MHGVVVHGVVVHDVVVHGVVVHGVVVSMFDFHCSHPGFYGPKAGLSSCTLDVLNVLYVYIPFYEEV